MRLVKPVKAVTLVSTFVPEGYGRGSYCDHIPVLIVQMTSLSLDFKLFAIVGIVNTDMEAKIRFPPARNISKRTDSQSPPEYQFSSCSGDVASSDQYKDIEAGSFPFPATLSDLSEKHQ
jgi:hypothetical protein